MRLLTENVLCLPSICLTLKSRKYQLQILIKRTKHFGLFFHLRFQECIAICTSFMSCSEVYYMNLVCLHLNWYVWIWYWYNPYRKRIGDRKILYESGIAKQSPTSKGFLIPDLFSVRIIIPLYLVIAQLCPHYIVLLSSLWKIAISITRS